MKLACIGGQLGRFRFHELLYEANRQADSAYYYQKFYEPSIMEYRSFQRHLALRLRPYRSAAY